MIKKLNRGYYVMAIREAADPPSWRWRIVRRGKPMGVRSKAVAFLAIRQHISLAAGRWWISLSSLSLKVSVPIEFRSAASSLL
jgi:hypothetical protein